MTSVTPRDETIVVTGGAGFVGSALVRRLLRRDTAPTVISFDALSYAGHRENLSDLDDPSRHTLVVGDIANARDVQHLFDDTKPTALINVAAETHVDRSNVSAIDFVRTNVLGTQTLLEAARHAGIPMVHVSTDEVYGSLRAPDRARPTCPLRPTNPYAASKAAGDLMALAALKTHGQDVRITRCTNNYGPRQMPEKLIPLMTLRALAGQPMPLYGDGLHTRDWIHVDDHASGIVAALDRGTPGAIYHFTANCPRTNLDIVREVTKYTGASELLIRHVDDRPAHDRRYALDDESTRSELGWAPVVPFASGLEETVRWFGDHLDWCRATGSENMRSFLRANYEARGT